MKNATTILVHPLVSPTILSLNVWYHLGFTNEPGCMNFYINGTLDKTFNTISQQTVRSINRAGNYFGKISWSADANAKAEYDDIKFFDRVLTQTEINDEFLYGSF